MRSTDLLLGVDIGTSDTKVLATTLDGREIAWVAAATRWNTRAGSLTETDPDQLYNAVLALAGQAVAAAERLSGPVRVRGIATTGLGEAGVLLDGQRSPVYPIIAWFDPRGSQEFEKFDTDVLEQFRGRTGLPLSSLASVAKLAWMRGQGTNLAGHTWLSVPEYLAYRLTGNLAAEYSLAARTGLLDQDTSAVWPAAVQALGADNQILPPLVTAGTPLGRVVRVTGTVPEVLVDAVVTVAGHDHPVAAVGSGAVGPDVAFDSFGTAQVLLRSTPKGLDYPGRERLALAGINTFHHVIGDRRILVAGTRSGLLLRRTLNLLGITDNAGREALDAAAMAESANACGISVAGARNDDGTLRITVDTDASSPAGLWLAVLAHGTREVDSLLDVMAAEVGPFAETVVAGGWTRMRSVRRAKENALPAVRFANRGQAGAFGAAMFASHATSMAEQLSATGDFSGNAVDHPCGPSDEFAAQFTHQP
jgi:sugar (pentulose or hexulose) kinase